MPRSAAGSSSPVPTSRDRIQRSSAVAASGAGATPASACSSTNRDAFQSLLASLAPSSIEPSAKRTSWVEHIFSSP